MSNKAELTGYQSSPCHTHCYRFYLSLGGTFRAGGSCTAHMVREALCQGVAG